MGKQIRFYHNATIERRVLSDAAALGLHIWRFDAVAPESFTAEAAASSDVSQFAFSLSASIAPRHMTGEFIEFSRPHNQALDARLWSEHTGTDESGRVAEAFERLRALLRKRSIHDEEAKLWVDRDFIDEFRQARAEEQRCLEELVRKNREYAVRVLGAKLSNT